MGSQGAALFYAGIWRAFPNPHLMIDEVVVEGDMLACRLLSAYLAACGFAVYTFDCAAKGSELFWQQVASPNKQRVPYAGAYHNLLLEQNQEQVFEDIVRWFELHL